METRTATAPKRRKVKLVVRIDHKRLEDLRALKKQTRVPMAHYLREAVDIILTTYLRGNE